MVEVGSARSSAGSILRPEPAELDDPVFGGAGLAFVAAAVVQHDEPVAVGGDLERARPRHRRRVLAVLDRMQEDVANGPVERIDAFDENDEIRPAKLAEEPRRQQRDFIARLELALVFELALFGPRGQKQRQHEDRDEKWRREPQDRAQAVGEADAGGEPDDHFAIRYQRTSVSSTVMNTVTETRILK